MEMFIRLVEKTKRRKHLLLLFKKKSNLVQILLFIWPKSKMKFKYCTVQFVELIEWQVFF